MRGRVGTVELTHSKVILQPLPDVPPGIGETRHGYFMRRYDERAGWDCRTDT